jgi:D-glycero-beta-D-manno-heptose-7-phosphate kinase
MSRIVSAIEQAFPSRKVVILGDLVADQFLNGTITRVSREAPVFILRHDDTVTLAGAAANASVNAASLGGQPILIGCAGTDTNGEMLVNVLESAGVSCKYVYRAEHVKTTTKLRVLASQHYAARQQVIRIDYEDPQPYSDVIKRQLRDNLSHAAVQATAIIISDYGYGAVFPEIFADALEISASRCIPLVVDSRYNLEKLKNATTATPNREEVEQILGAKFTSEDCSLLVERLGLEAILLTNGNKGISLFERGRPPKHLDAVGAKEPVDVTGAGDTVIAAYALGLAAGLSFEEAATAANHAGGIVVMKKRTAAVQAYELINSLRGNADASISHA